MIWRERENDGEGWGQGGREIKTHRGWKGRGWTGTRRERDERRGRRLRGMQGEGHKQEGGR